MSGMMPMGMGMPMMGMPMMGMPMMNPMMAMPMMNQMNPMMNPMGVTSMGSKTPSGPSAGCGNTVAPPAKASPSSSTGGLMPKLDTPTVPTGPTPTRLEPGRVVSGRERSRSRDVEREPKLEPKEEPIQPVREKTPPRCHLHNTKKPNAKCKFCQKWLSSQSQSQCQKVPEKEDAKDEKAKVHLEKRWREDYSRRTFKSSTLLKRPDPWSSYFKSLLEVSDLPPLTDEIARYADTLDVYNSGNNVHPSCFILSGGPGGNLGWWQLYSDGILVEPKRDPELKFTPHSFLYILRNDDDKNLSHNVHLAWRKALHVVNVVTTYFGPHSAVHPRKQTWNEITLLERNHTSAKLHVWFHEFHVCFQAGYNSYPTKNKRCEFGTMHKNDITCSHVDYHNKNTRPRSTMTFKVLLAPGVPTLYIATVWNLRLIGHSWWTSFSQGPLCRCFIRALRCSTT